MMRRVRTRNSDGSQPSHHHHHVDQAAPESVARGLASTMPRRLQICLVAALLLFATSIAVFSILGQPSAVSSSSPLLRRSLKRRGPQPRTNEWNQYEHQQNTTRDDSLSSTTIATNTTQQQQQQQKPVMQTSIQTENK